MKTVTLEEQIALLKQEEYERQVVQAEARKYTDDFLKRHSYVYSLYLDLKRGGSRDKYMNALYRQNKRREAKHALRRARIAANKKEADKKVFYQISTVVSHSCKGSVSGGLNLLGTNSKSGVPNPGWRTMIARGSEAGTNYTRNIYKVGTLAPWCTSVNKMPYSCDGKIGYKHWYSAQATCGIGAAFKKAYDDSEVNAIANSKIRNFINKADAHTNALVPLVELRDLRSTVHGISDATQFLVASIIDIRKAVKHPKEVLKYASDAWLTYSFGVKPMLNDAENIAASIASSQAGPSQNTFSAMSKKTWRGFSETSGLSDGGGLQQKVIRSHEMELTVRYGCGLKHLVKSANSYGSTADLNKHLNLQIQSFVPALWELIPYSWLLDYFGTIGDVMSDTFESNVPSLRYAFKSVKYEERVTCNHKATINSSGYSAPTTWGTTSPGKQVYYHMHYARNVISTLPVRPLRIRSMDEIGTNGINKVLNLVSILGKSNRVNALRL